MATSIAERIDEPGADGPRVRPDDFVRLGIGVREARVGVIRRAAGDATAAVALDEPTEARADFDTRIARIAASTYRLLDPRRRNELIQRIQLLQLESPPAQVKPWWRPRHATVVEHGQIRDRFDPSAAELTYQPAGLRPESSWKAWARRMGLIPYSRRTTMVAAIFTATMLLFVLPVVIATTTSEDVPTGESTAATTPVSAVPEPIVRRQPSAGRKPKLTTEFPKPATTDPATAETSPFAQAFAPDPLPTPPGEANNADAATEPSSPSITRLPGTEPTAADPLIFVPNVEPGDPASIIAPNPTPSPQPAADPAMPADATTSDAAMPDDGAAMPSDPDPDPPSDEKSATETPTAEPSGADPSATVDEMPDTNPFAQVAAAEEEAKANLDATDPRFPEPSAEKIAVAMERLARLRSDLPPAGSDGELLANIRSLLRTASESESGSADRWVLLLESSQHLLMMGRVADAEQTLADLSTEFQISAVQLRQRLLDPVVSGAQTITQKERVISWALSTSEQLLQTEDFDSAAAALRGATTLAVKLGSSDLRLRVNLQADAIKQAKRIAPLASKTLAEATPTTASSSAANSVGRYLCFYLSDWPQGLPWLAYASTPKLAKVAQLEIDSAAMPDGTLDLVDNWIQCAADVRGRGSESILLHARGLLADAILTSSGLKQKDLERKLSEIDAMLPADLRTAVPTAPATPPPAPAMAAANLSGMLGRLKADGLDASALIRYDAGLNLTHDAFSQILNSLGIKAGVIGLDFVGIVDLPEATTLRFVTSTGTDKADVVAVSVNNQPVQLALDGQQNLKVGTLDLPAGSHLVRWQFSGKQLSTCHLSIEDDRAKKPLTLRHTAAMLEQILAAAPARLRVNVVRAN